MSKFNFRIALTLMLFMSSCVFAQAQAPSITISQAAAPEPSQALSEPVTGPVIQDYGPVYPVGKKAVNLKKGKTYKVLMDVSASGDFAMAVNPKLDSAARFLNMHAQHGVDPDDLRLTVVVHGAATKDLLTNEAYRERFGVFNPNTRLLERLVAAGVEVLVCGQSAVHKGFRPEDFQDGVDQAVSAMSAHVRRQSEGYALIPF